jgi:hypothetical protein
MINEKQGSVVCPILIIAMMDKLVNVREEKRRPYMKILTFADHMFKEPSQRV